jgi:hypothetical protein
MADVTIINEGTIALMRPNTPAARTWVDQHIGQENGYQPLWPTVVVEPRYLEPILAGLVDCGLTIKIS